jgi:hypothetical protein
MKKSPQTKNEIDFVAYICIIAGIIILIANLIMNRNM